MKVTRKIKIGTALPYIGLVIVTAFFAIVTGGKTLSLTNLWTIVGQLFTTLLSATGAIFVMSMGSLDFSQGSTLGICCFVAAVLSSTSIPLAFAASIACGAIIGLFNGLMVAKLKVKSFVATICIMFMLRGLLQYLCQDFSPKASAEILKMDIIGTKLAVAFLILMAAYIVYTYTPFGRYVRMIGSGEIAVKYSGVNVNAIKIVSFVLAGTLAGVAGIFSLLRTGGVIATSGNLLETDVMISLVLGGLPITGGMKSRFSAVVIGALLLTVLANGLVQIGASVVLQQMIKGIVFLAVISVTMDRNADLIK